MPRDPTRHANTAPTQSTIRSVIDRRVQHRLEDLAAQGLDRLPPPVEAREGVHYRLGRHGSLITLCSNDYLGLASEPLPPISAPLGAGASRLVCGDLQEHRALERDLAAALGTEDAVVFPSGYQANVGALSSLLDPDDLVYSDALNHASLIDGIRLSRARPLVIDHLAFPPHLLANPQATAPDARVQASAPCGDARDPLSAQRPSDPAIARWWIVESTYSMDGDAHDPAHLSAHLDAGHPLYVDEAHSFGLYAGGAGLCGARGLTGALVVAAPLGKAAGAAGAAIGASHLIAHWLRTKSRAFVFSTGMSPALAYALRHRLEALHGTVGDQRRARLRENLDALAAALEIPRPHSPILPFIVGDNAQATAASRALIERGWHVQAIRPPTVPPGTARLRVTVSALHDPKTLRRFAADLREVLATYGPQPPLHPTPGR